MLKSMVREALEASVLCSKPPVSFHTKKLSTVPNNKSPLSALSLAPSTLSKIQANLDAEKYGSINKPVLSWTIFSNSGFLRSLQNSDVLLSCQTIAG